MSGLSSDQFDRLAAALIQRGDVYGVAGQLVAEAWDEGWNACFDYMSAECVGPDDPPNPYRAALANPAEETP